MKNYVPSLFRLIRVNNLLIIFFSQLFIYYSLNTSFNQLSFITFILISMGTFLISAAGYIINDYYDLKIDVINKPEAVLIDRAISRKSAIILHSVFNLSALLLGVFIGWKVQLLFIISILLLWWYSSFLKRLPFWGNLAVALLSSLSVLIFRFGFAVDVTLLYFYASLVFLITLVREIVKDMEDFNGDASNGCKTLPIKYGIRKAKYISGIILIVFYIYIMTITPFIDFKIFVFFVLTLNPVILIALKKLIPADKKEDFAAISSLCKWIMVIGVVSIVMSR